jgi:hypothetical protein
MEYRAVALSIGMQQAILQIILKKLRAGTALAAILAPRDSLRRLIFRSKLLNMMTRDGTYTAAVSSS